MSIEAVDSRNLAEILPLIRDYQRFYGVDSIDDEKNRRFFSQFGLHASEGCQFLYRKENKAVAFASVYFSFSSTLAEKVGVLNDLYTHPDHRKCGAATALIEHCREFVKRSGAFRLQWVTATDNTLAQRTYDALEAKKSTWHFYTYNTQED